MRNSCRIKVEMISYIYIPKDIGKNYAYQAGFR